MSWEWFFFIGFGLLTVRFCFFWFGHRRARQFERQFSSKNGGAYQPLVSVVVPARNEEQHIAECVHSIFRNDYPHFEVIVVDDQSEDRTAEILYQLQQQYGQRLQVVSTQSVDSPLVGKARALATGVRYATGEILLFTDADCIVPATWIAAMVQPFQSPAVGCVASFSSMVAHRWFDQLQQVEWLYNHTLARAGLGWNVPLGCFGNNLAIRHSAYQQTGGLEQIPYSMLTEDLALLLAVRQQRYRCVYMLSPQTYVLTYPLRTFREYLRQHHRWVHGGTALGWKAVAFMTVTVAYWLGLIAALLGSPPAAVLLLGARCVYDVVLLLPAVRTLRQWEILRPRLISILLFFQLLEVSLPLFLIPRHVYWKDRRLKR